MADRQVGRIMTANTKSPMIQMIKAENMELKKISRGSAQPSPSASTGRLTCRKLNPKWGARCHHDPCEAKG